MMKILKGLLGRISSEQPANAPKSIAKPKRPNGTGDFRAVEIAPCLICCPAAMQVAGRSYLLFEAPRLPLQGCTTPTNCSCRFRKHADRRGNDRRLFGAAETNRWFVGTEGRKPGARRLPGLDPAE